jgi:SAM-dependent methyltransferase
MGGERVPAFGERLADAVLRAGGQWPSTGEPLVIRLRTSRSEGPRGDADVVIDVHDVDWPVIRHITARLADRELWHLTETRAFFGARAAAWDAKFGDDGPAYAAAVTRMGIEPGAIAVDVGCGTGRALAALRRAVGARGTVIGIDITPQMLAAARSRGRDRSALLVLGDARRLPLRDSVADAVFAAGLLAHLPVMTAGLAELSRVCRPGGRLALFHPTGRAALAQRHARVLAADDPLAEGPLRMALRATGWQCEAYDDGADHFFVLAGRTG